MTAPAPPSVSTRRISPWKKAIVVALVLVGARQILKAYVVEGFKISTATMQPTLAPGDFFFARKDAYGFGHRRLPDRGDVIVFRSPDQGDKQTTSRVMGLPGDTIRIEGGAVSVNGFRIATCVAGPAKLKSAGEEHSFIVVVELVGDRAYLVAHDEAGLQKREQAKSHGDEHGHDHHHGAGVEGPYTVQPNEVFVLGDNRENADDSRSWGDLSGIGVPFDRIIGRASTVWMSSDEKGSVVRARLGMSLTGTPLCPAWVPAETCTAAERCLADPPARETTTPPPPPSALSQ